MNEKQKIVHGTALAIAEQGVLLLGRSGSGKSDLALRLIDRGALLVSDDAVTVDTTGKNPLVRAAPNIEAMLEIRGVGIRGVAATASAQLRLVADLECEPERLPPDRATYALYGFDVPLVHIAPFEASAAIKLEYALRSVVDADQWPVAQGATSQPKAEPLD